MRWPFAFAVAPGVLGMVLLGCGSSSDRSPLPSSSSSRSSAGDTTAADETGEASADAREARGDEASHANLANESPLEAVVRTTALAPAPIRIRLADLPAPFATDSARKRPEVVDPPDDATLSVPEGFVVQLFASEVPMARWLHQAPDGSVLVAQSREDRITRLRDADGDGVADERGPFATDDNGLDIPFGMAFVGNAFYLGNHDEVRRYPYRAGQTRLEGEGEAIVELPGGGYRQHWTRNVVADPNGERLFVSVGSRTNVDPEELPRASVQVLPLDGGSMRTFSFGLRNPVGLAFQPKTGVLYTTVNERDGMGDDLVPDYLTRLEDGAFYGWPYAWLAPERLDPRRTREGGRSERPDLVARTKTPDVLFQAHSAALGLDFYDGDAFPARYRGGAFVAFRGSWNRDRGTGYQIVFVPFDGQGRPEGSYEPFVSGFLIDPEGPTTWGRPVGVLVTRDGALLFTDETGGRVYRVSYPRGTR